jgi:hypothetical protein
MTGGLVRPTRIVPAKPAKGNDMHIARDRNGTIYLIDPYGYLIDSGIED